MAALSPEPWPRTRGGSSRPLPLTSEWGGSSQPFLALSAAAPDLVRGVALSATLSVPAVTAAYHIFFIHFFADGHLDYFHILATVNSAAMNIRRRVDGPRGCHTK